MHLFRRVIITRSETINATWLFCGQVMQRDHGELKKLRVEVHRLEVECQQGKTLNKNLTQIKGEKGILEEKVIIKIKVTQ